MRRDEDVDDEQLAREERVALNREVSNALRSMAALRTTYVVVASLVGVVLLLTVLAAPFGWWTVVLAGVFALDVVGAVQVMRRPLPWAVAMAVAWTLWAVLDFVVRSAAARDAGEPHPTVSLANAIDAVFVLAFWGAVGLAARLSRIVKDRPELRAVRRMRGVRAEDEHVGMSTLRQDEARRTRSRSRRALLAIGAGGIALVALVVFLMSRSGGGAKGDARSGTAEDAEGESARAVPPATVPVDEAAQRFAAAFQAARWDDAKAAFAAEDRERMGAMLTKLVARYGWEQKPPKLSEPAVTPGSYRATVWYDLEADSGPPRMKTTWRWDGRAWNLSSLALK